MVRKLGQKTYSHLSDLDHVAGHYEIATTSLLYHIDRGLAVEIEAQEWQQQFLYGSPLIDKPWEEFIDPRKAYYAKYVEQQHQKEAYAAKVLEEIERSQALAGLPSEALTIFSNTIPVLRFVFHCLQMISSYLGHIAPSSRVLIPLLFQSADEMRRVQLMAYLMGLFRRHHHGFGDDATATWEESCHWQPLRKILEEMLVTYDFSEAMISLTQVIKPRIDLVLMKGISDVAKKYHVHLLDHLFLTIADDALWHQQWSDALINHINADGQESDLIKTWKNKWEGPTENAIDSIANALLKH